MATPRIRPMPGTTSTNSDASVIVDCGTTPACDCTRPPLTIPNVAVGAGAGEPAAGVITAYPDRTVPCSTSVIGNGTVDDGGREEIGCDGAGVGAGAGAGTVIGDGAGAGIGAGVGAGAGAGAG